MRINTNELFLYRNFEHQSLFDTFAGIINSYDSINYEEIKKSIYSCANSLVEMAIRYGFEGNLWHCFLTYTLANSENAFSRALEIGGNTSGTINLLAENDLAIFKQLYDFDLNIIDKVLGINCLCHISDFNNSGNPRAAHAPAIRTALRNLTLGLHSAADTYSFQKCITEFYRQFGVGKFAMYKAFKVYAGSNNVEI
ncbi:MAG: hypothetical protein K0R50_4739, partial [Eubacterium sp.]|nr:hypothetical protein [Eubacterium sp.]